MLIINNYAVEGITTFGQLTLIISTAGLISSALSMRTAEAVTKFLLELKNDKDKKTIILTSFFSDIIISFFVFIVLFLFSNKISLIFLKSTLHVDSIFYYSLISVIEIMRGLPHALFQSKKLFNWINFFLGFRSLLQIIIITFLFKFGYNDLESIISGLLIGSFILIVMEYSLFLNKTLRIFFNKESINYLILNKYIKFNIVTFSSTSIKALHQHLDKLIIGYFFSVNLVGIYATLKKITSPIIFFAAPLQLIYYPKIIEWNKKNKSKIVDIINKSLRKLSLAGILYSSILLMALPYALNLTGIAFNDKYYLYVSIILLITILNNNQWWTRSYANATNPIYSVYLNTFSLLFQPLICLPMTFYLNFEGFLFSQVILSSLLLFIWIIKLNEK